MMKTLLSLCLAVLCTLTASANYTTPGTGIKLTLGNLVTNSAGDVTFSGEFYTVNDTITISLNDTLSITNDATVKFVVGTFFDVSGTVIINPPTGVLFTAVNPATGYLGMRLNASTASSFKKLTLEYAVSLRLSDCSPRIDSCTFQYNNNNTSTTFGNGAIALFRSSPIIINSRFLNNQRAAIQGGANIANAPKISNCLFLGNNTTNQNVPQINLGSSGTDTTKIINNQILRSSYRSGAIGFLPIGDVYAVITSNQIKNNRYGITFNGGANINAMVSYNVIDSNNTEGDPLLGGSGISFSGGSSTSHQNTIVTGNYIRWNLWGVTISPTSTGGGARPNLGNITNADTSDDGKNHFFGNYNATTPFIDLYNNNVDDIFAQNNDWGSNNPDTVEARIFHKPDNNSLGLVNFSNYILPVHLTNFTASTFKNDVTLQWKTRQETNTDYFSIERSENGQAFSSIGKTTAMGTSAIDKNYSFLDRGIAGNTPFFYRLKMVDKNAAYTYSNVIAVRIYEQKTGAVKLFPTIIRGSQNLTAAINSATDKQVTVQVFTTDGKQLFQLSKQVIAGNNNFTFQLPAAVPNGLLQVKFTGVDLNTTLTVVKE